MAYEYILSERLDGVALITLNRPEKLNALSFPLMQEVDDALTIFEADDDIQIRHPDRRRRARLLGRPPTSTRWPG